MTYPVGIKYVLDCLKYLADYQMGKLTYKELMNCPKSESKNYILSKNHVFFK